LLQITRRKRKRKRRKKKMNKEALNTELVGYTVVIRMVLNSGSRN
jgi:50S ribosomal subunit-associated GTPase HflX